MLAQDKQDSNFQIAASQLDLYYHSLQVCIIVYIFMNSNK